MKTNMVAPSTVVRTGSILPFGLVMNDVATVSCLEREGLMSFFGRKRQGERIRSLLEGRRGHK